MEQSETMEVESTKESNNEAEEEQEHDEENQGEGESVEDVGTIYSDVMVCDEAEGELSEVQDETHNTSPTSAENQGDEEEAVGDVGTVYSDVMVCGGPEGELSEGQNETEEDEEQCEMSSSNVDVVIMEDDKECDEEEGTGCEDQEGGSSDEAVNPLAAMDEQDEAEKPSEELDGTEEPPDGGEEAELLEDQEGAEEVVEEGTEEILEEGDGTEELAEEGDTEEIVEEGEGTEELGEEGTEEVVEEGDGGEEPVEEVTEEQDDTEKAESDSDIVEVPSNMENADSGDGEGGGGESEAMETDSPEKQPDEMETNEDKVVAGSKDKTADGEDLDDSEEIVEVPVHKKPAMLVDLAIDDESPKKTKKKPGPKKGSANGKMTGDPKKIKLRSLASLVDVNSDEEAPASTTVSTSHGDMPGIGEIVEHGVIIGSNEMDGLQLRISNVVGGEDCITGLTVDEDRDSFPSIQISSVTTLINPLSPEDPNSNKEDGDKTKDDENEGGGDAETSADSTKEPQSSGTEAVTTVVASKESGEKTVESSKDSSVEDAQDSTKEKDPQSSNSRGPMIRLSSVVSEVAKDTDRTEENAESRHIYHILRSILTVKRECIICCKNIRCEFRIVKKFEPGTWAFLCSSECRTQWTESLAFNHVVEKPRLIFEKLCGMCAKDLSNLPRKGQYSWETREFCAKECLTEHLNEVAGRCYMCTEKVATMFIGKYCVRFGSDIHQFCSNTCLECYKTKIKVCCYCQKNLEKVPKVTSVSNKEYCSAKCLKRAQRRDIGQQNHIEQFPCTVCQTVTLNKYEFVTNQESFQLCSDPCLNVYKYANKVKAVPCCLCFRVMNAEDVSHYLYHGGHQLRVFCSDSCVNVFILSARKIVVCELCKVKKYNFDMIHGQVDEEFKDYFYCSLSCLNNKTVNVGKKSKNGVTSSNLVNGSLTPANTSDPPITNCSMCNTIAKAQYHMVMSDNTLRSFCRYSCAAKYKNTFGFQVNGIQPAESTETTTTTTTTAPVIREKTSILKTTSTQSDDVDASQLNQTKKKTVADSMDEVTAELLKLFTPPTMVNKSTSCRPNTTTKGVFCKPHPWNRSSQTDLSDINCKLYSSKPPPVLPVPVPVYIPTPMMSFNVPYPVPVFVPVPLPVPIFIPTSAKTTKDIAKMMNKIQDEMPEDPYEAEMLLLARASSESAEADAKAKDEEGEGEAEEVDFPQKILEQSLEIPSELPSASGECHSDGTGAAMPRSELAGKHLSSRPPLSNNFDPHGGLDDLKDIDVSCLDNLEDDIPRFSLKPLDDSDILDTNLLSDNSYSDEDEEPTSRKRKHQYDDESSNKRFRQSDCEFTTPGYTTEHLDEEYTCPDLNKVYGLAAWKKWVTAKNAELAGVSSSRSMRMISDDLLAMNCEELNYALCLFLKDIRKSNGDPYQPDTVFYLLLGIQQHLFDSGRTDCIFMDFGFEKFTNSFDEITKNFVNEAVLSDEGDVSDVGVTRITESMLWECRQLGAHTPQVLLNTLFYFNTKIFKFKTVEEHQELAFPKVVKQWRRTSVGNDSSVTRTTLLKFFAPKKDGKKRVFEMPENKEDPLRCPVKLYEFYLSKCPESLRNQPNMYYVYPERSCVPDSPTWFSNQSVQAASLSKMLHRALMVKEVQESFVE